MCLRFYNLQQSFENVLTMFKLFFEKSENCPTSPKTAQRKFPTCSQQVPKQIQHKIKPKSEKVLNIIRNNIKHSSQRVLKKNETVPNEFQKRSEKYQTRVKTKSTDLEICKHESNQVQKNWQKIKRTCNTANRTNASTYKLQQHKTEWIVTAQGAEIWELARY